MVPSGRRPPPPPPSPLSPTSPLQKPSQDSCPPPLPKRHPKDEPDVKTEDEYEQPLVQAKDYEPMAAPNPVNISAQRKQGIAAPKLDIISNLEMALKNRKERQAETNKSENSPKSWNPSQLDLNTINKKLPVHPNKNTEKERKISDPKQPIATLLDKSRRLTDGEAVVPSMPTQDDVYEEPTGPPPRINQRQQPSNEEDTDESWDSDWDEGGGQDSKKEDDGEVYEIPDGANEDYVPVDDGKPPPLPRDRHPLPVPPITASKKEMPPATPLKPLISNLHKTVPQKEQNKKTPPAVNKPAPPEKPTKKLLDGPQLPPRVLPSQEKRNSKSDDNSSAGSTSSGSVSMHQETAQTNGTQDLRSQSKVRVLPHIPLPGITKIKEPNAPAPCDEIYDDAASEYLGTYGWFHPKVDRKEAERRISQLRENGSFLVRESGSGKDGATHPYTLVVLYNNKPYNLQLRERSDKRFAIGKHKPDEVSFATVPELITHHKSNNIKLEDGTVMLKNTPSKR